MWTGAPFASAKLARMKASMRSRPACETVEARHRRMRLVDRAEDLDMHDRSVERQRLEQRAEAGVGQFRRRHVIGPAAPAEQHPAGVGIVDRQAGVAQEARIRQAWSHRSERRCRCGSGSPAPGCGGPAPRCSTAGSSSGRGTRVPRIRATHAAPTSSRSQRMTLWSLRLIRPPQDGLTIGEPVAAGIRQPVRHAHGQGSATFPRAGRRPTLSAGSG